MILDQEGQLRGRENEKVLGLGLTALLAQMGHIMPWEI